MKKRSTAEIVYAREPLAQVLVTRGDQAATAVYTSVISVAFAVMLLAVYRFYVTVRYDYTGAIWNPTPLTIATGLLTTAVLAVFLPITIRRAGDMLVHVVFLIAVVPSLVIPSARSNLAPTDYVVNQIAFAGCFVFLLLLNRAPIVNLSITMFSQRSFTVLLVGITAFMLLPVVLYFGAPTSVPGFSEIYDRRLASRESIAAMPVFVGYFWFWLARISAPFLIAYGLSRKARLLVVFGLLITLYLFSLTALKSVVFAVAVVFGVWMLLKVFGKYLSTYLVTSALAIVIIGALADFAFGLSAVSDLISRRTFIVPGILTEQYLRFYSEMEFSRWSYSFLGVFFDNPHDGAPSAVVGSFFYSEDTTATAHIFADGYANFGYYGMAFVTLIIGIVIWFLNSVTIGKSAYLVLPLVALSGYMIANTAMTTALVTHGVLLTLVVLQLSPTVEQFGERGQMTTILAGRKQR